jgi:hypothetical protein
MPSKNHKKDVYKQKKHTHKKNKDKNINYFSSDSTINNVLNYKNVEHNNNQIINSYPFQNLGYNFPNPSYSVQIKRRPDDKYFKNYKYDYNVQVNKPVLTYDNFITQEALKNMTPAEYRYYNQFQEKYYIYNGNYEVANQKPLVLAIQSNLNYPVYSGPNAVEFNANMYQNNTPSQNSNQNVISGFNTGNVQIYGNSPAYTGVQAKTLPGQNLIAQQNFTQTKANNANINSPAYGNYGNYFY